MVNIDHLASIEDWFALLFTRITSTMASMRLSRTKSLNCNIADLTREFQRNTDYYDVQKRVLQEEISAVPRASNCKAQLPDQHEGQRTTERIRQSRSKTDLSRQQELLRASQSKTDLPTHQELFRVSRSKADLLAQYDGHHNIENAVQTKASRCKGSPQDNQHRAGVRDDELRHTKASRSKSDGLAMMSEEDCMHTESTKQAFRASRARSFSSSIGDLTRELQSSADLVFLDPTTTAALPARVPPPATPSVPTSPRAPTAGPAPDARASGAGVLRGRSFRGIAQLTQELRDSDGGRDRAVRDLLTPLAPVTPASAAASRRPGAGSLQGGSAASSHSGAAGLQGNSAASFRAGAAGLQGNSAASSRSGATGMQGNSAASFRDGATGLQGYSADSFRGGGSIRGSGYSSSAPTQACRAAPPTPTGAGGGRDRRRGLGVGARGAGGAWGWCGPCAGASPSSLADPRGRARSGWGRAGRLQAEAGPGGRVGSPGSCPDGGCPLAGPASGRSQWCASHSCRRARAGWPPWGNPGQTVTDIVPSLIRVGPIRSPPSP